MSFKDFHEHIEVKKMIGTESVSVQPFLAEKGAVQ